MTGTRLASARVESFLKVIREHLRGSEERSDFAALSAGPSPHEDCLAEDAFVDDVRGAVLGKKKGKNKQARREEVQRCRGVGVWEPVLRGGVEAEGAKAVSFLVGSTPTRVMRVDRTTVLDRS